MTEELPTDFETEDFRDTAILMSPNVNFDGVYNFYYDETNNPRKVYIREEDFNASFQSNFVIGGIIDNQELIEFSLFEKSLNLQPNVKEIKFKHIASGSFTGCLKSEKLKLYLKFIIDAELDVHFSSLNTLYFGIVDIVDSAIMNTKEVFERGPEFITVLKDIFYQIIRKEILKTQKVFYKYKYPNIKSEQLTEFIMELMSIIEPYEEEDQYAEYISILKNAINNSDELVFIQDEKDLELLKDFSHFYLRPIYLFNKSFHTFDKENVIEKEIRKYKLLFKTEELQNYSFKDSKDSIFIQLSDVFVGLCGKLSGFIISNTEEEIAIEVDKMNDLQKENLKYLFQLISTSRNKNPGFVHWTSPVSEILKTEYLERLALS